jgi:2,4-dichlorophenol 6-monooxygenase
VHEAGAVLVRPDGYVAWRQSAAVWDDGEALRQLTEALSAVLDRPVGSEPGTTTTPSYSTRPVEITVPQSHPATSGGDR